MHYRRRADGLGYRGCLSIHKARSVVGGDMFGERGGVHLKARHRIFDRRNALEEVADDAVGDRGPKEEEEERFHDIQDRLPDYEKLFFDVFERRGVIRGDVAGVWFLVHGVGWSNL